MIELRSDSFTLPCSEMKEAMVRARLGDDQYGEDPAVNELQDYACSLLGFEAALFMPSGTQANLAALLSHCERGDEYIAGQESHILKWEGGGAAMFGGIVPQSLPQDARGIVELDRIEAAIKPSAVFFPRTRLLCLEDTFWGHALPISYIDDFCSLARTRSLATHLDGARLFNASVCQHVDPKRIVGAFDSATVCLSKGLGAPVGSLLLSSADLISKAHRWRKLLGGAMRQSGVLASAGLYALQNNIPRLREDHDKAAALRDRLGRIDAVDLVSSEHQTNMVTFNLRNMGMGEFVRRMAEHGVNVLPTNPLRLVVHRDLSWNDVHCAIEAAEAVLTEQVRHE